MFRIKTLLILAIRFILGPPIGGALYARFGFRGPFIFGLGVTVLDLLGRLLIIERKDVLSWEAEVTTVASASIQIKNEDEHSTPEAELVHGSHRLPRGMANGMPASTPRSLSLLFVMCKLSRSSRALAIFVVTFTYGYGPFNSFECRFWSFSRMVIVGAEPSIVLHLQSVWSMDSRKVGLVFLGAIFPAMLCQ